MTSRRPANRYFAAAKPPSELVTTTSTVCAAETNRLLTSQLPKGWRSSRTVKFAVVTPVVSGRVSAAQSIHASGTSITAAAMSRIAWSRNEILRFLAIT